MVEHDSERGGERPAEGERHGERPADGERRGFWDEYWDRFRRQEVDDPVKERREGYWERFRRQEVDDPVEPRKRGDRSA
jgi:hypothetical protein